MIHMTCPLAGWKKLTRSARRRLRGPADRVKCAACGTENGGGDVYCRGCGRPLSR